MSDMTRIVMQGGTHFQMQPALREIKRLSNKTALITGGTSGIGLAAAQLFEAEGARVLVTGRSPENLAQTRAALSDDAIVVASDAGDVAAIDVLLRQAEQHFGKLDVMFLNAGMCISAAPEMVTEADFDATISINLKSVFFTIQKALPILNPGASIIVTTSISNRLGSPNACVYAAAKAGLLSMMRSLALHLAAQGIRVNAISPGPIDTPMHGRMGLGDLGRQQMRITMKERSPSKRLGLPEEVAKVALFLASEDSIYIVGEEIVVDGGRLLL